MAELAVVRTVRYTDVTLVARVALIMNTMSVKHVYYTNKHQQTVRDILSQSYVKHRHTEHWFDLVDNWGYLPVHFAAFQSISNIWETHCHNGRTTCCSNGNLTVHACDRGSIIRMTSSYLLFSCHCEPRTLECYCGVLAIPFTRCRTLYNYASSGWPIGCSAPHVVLQVMRRQCHIYRYQYCKPCSMKLHSLLVLLLVLGDWHFWTVFWVFITICYVDQCWNYHTSGFLEKFDRLNDLIDRWKRMPQTDVC